MNYLQQADARFFEQQDAWQVKRGKVRNVNHYYAKRESWGDWVKVPRDQYQRLVRQGAEVQ
jgi:hypothetical protein